MVCFVLLNSTIIFIRMFYMHLFWYQSVTCCTQNKWMIRQYHSVANWMSGKQTGDWHGSCRQHVSILEPSHASFQQMPNTAENCKGASYWNQQANRTLLWYRKLCLLKQVNLLLQLPQKLLICVNVYLANPSSSSNSSSVQIWKFHKWVSVSKTWFLIYDNLK